MQKKILQQLKRKKGGKKGMKKKGKKRWKIGRVRKGEEKGVSYF